jgi:hypothetical protein
LVGPVIDAGAEGVAVTVTDVELDGTALQAPLVTNALK